jgi:hypothetical protein
MNSCLFTSSLIFQVFILFLSCLFACPSNVVTTGQRHTRRGVGRSSNLIKIQHFPVAAVAAQSKPQDAVWSRNETQCVRVFTDVHWAEKFSVMTLDDKMLHFIIATIIGLPSDALIIITGLIFHSYNTKGRSRNTREKVDVRKW